MITVEEYFMGRRQSCAGEYKPEFADYATELLGRVNTLLRYYGDNPGVRSGWRPPSINSCTKNASPTSLHMVARAVDLNDSGQHMQKWLVGNTDLLVKCELWMEHPDSTPSWVHVQSLPPKSGNRIFRVK